MVEYHSSMDRAYWDAPERPVERLSEPIIPINELGTTFVEKNPATGGHIIQNLQSTIRSGASVGQLVLNVSSQQVVGGRPKAYGEEVRQAIKELAQANKFNIAGIEMPTSSMSNLSGFNQQNYSFSLEKRKQDMQEVRDAMKLAADIAGGGGVDVWSQEFPRIVYEQDWAKDVKGNLIFDVDEAKEGEGVKILVDQRSGDRIAGLAMSTKQKIVKWKHKLENGKIVYLDKDDKPITSFKDFDKRVAVEKDGVLQLEEKPKGIQDYSPEKIVGCAGMTKEELFWSDIAVAQINQAEGLAKRYNAEARRYGNMVGRLQKELDALKSDPEGNKDEIKEKASEIDTWKAEIQGMQLQAAGSEQQAAELKEKLQNTVSAETFGKEKSVTSYAELGIFAMQETDNNRDKITKPLHVGPELGWPGAFGGHPKEFMRLIKESRNKMVALLTEKEIEEQGKKIANPYFNPEISKDVAAEKAKTHIKGLFDTGHLGMWLDHFRRVPNESEEKRLKEFEKWYLEQVDELVKSGTVGSIQAVDSASGAHGHLPPGEGILPVVEAVEKFKKAGFQGFIVSEGHEEEQFGHNRILTQTWKNFGSPISAPNGYLVGPQAGGGFYGVPWKRVESAYFGRTYNPFFIVGAYSPSNEWKLWSEVPFE